MSGKRYFVLINVESSIEEFYVLIAARWTNKDQWWMKKVKKKKCIVLLCISAFSSNRWEWEIQWFKLKENKTVRFKALRLRSIFPTNVSWVRCLVTQVTFIHYIAKQCIHVFCWFVFVYINSEQFFRCLALDAAYFFFLFIRMTRCECWKLDNAFQLLLNNILAWLTNLITMTHN